MQGSVLQDQPNPVMVLDIKIKNIYVSVLYLVRSTPLATEKTLPETAKLDHIHECEILPSFKYLDKNMVIMEPSL